MKPGRHTVIGRVRVPNFVVDGHVPPLHRLLHCKNAPGDDVEERKAHRRLSVAVRVHETDGERGDVGSTVLIGRQQHNELREAGLDATCGSGSALHVRVFADEHDLWAFLKVVVDGVDEPTEQVPRVAGGAKVAAGVGLAHQSSLFDGGLDSLVLIVAVWVNPSAENEEAVFTNNRDATFAALQQARDAGPEFNQALAAMANPSNPYFRTT